MQFHLSLVIPYLIYSISLLFIFSIISICTRPQKSVKSSRENNWRSKDNSSIRQNSNRNDSQKESKREIVEKSSKSEKSQSSRKETKATDSIKVLKTGRCTPAILGRKFSTKVEKSDKSDSPHTEIINVPLGKALEDIPESSILTNASDQKIKDSSSPSKNFKRVRFFENMKSRRSTKSSKK